MQTDTLYLAMLACPRRKLTRDFDPVFIATYTFFPPWAAQPYHLSRISRSTPNSVIDTIMTESQRTLNRLMPVVVGSCKEYNVGSPIDRHSAKCRASTLRSQDSLRSEALHWGQPEGVPVAGPTELPPSIGVPFFLSVFIRMLRMLRPKLQPTNSVAPRTERLA